MIDLFLLSLYYHKNSQNTRLVKDGRLSYTIRLREGGMYMGEKNWLELMNRQILVKQIQESNHNTKKYGLTLSEKDTELLIAEKNEVLKAEQRVEFGQSILPQIIYAFCDSDFLSQDNYLETLIRLQEIFFLYKNEMQDEISDEELLNFMREQFEETCCGDLEYLESTCLEIFAEAIRAGYRGYQITQGKGEFSKIDIVQRWDREVYLQVLKELCWR